MLDEDLDIWCGGCGGMRGRCFRPAENEGAVFGLGLAGTKIFV